MGHEDRQIFRGQRPKPRSTEEKVPIELEGLFSVGRNETEFRSERKGCSRNLSRPISLRLIQGEWTRFYYSASIHLV